MARYRGPKHKIARQEGANIWEKSSPSLERRLNVPPGMHGPRGRKRQSDFALQLREKQKLKRTYGILERQFRRYFQKAAKKRGATGEVLLQNLETRLDNLVYRLGMAPSRPAARQLVSHGHVKVNDKKVNIPSYSVRPGDVISLSSKTMEIPAVKKLLGEKRVNLPAYLERKGPVGRLVRLPHREEANVDINDQLIIEYYSR